MFSRVKRPRHVFIGTLAYRTMKSLSSGALPNETGGPMVGYATTDDALVVCHVAGPGPNGVCTPASVWIDGAFSTAFCRRAEEVSGGRLQYLGDWHVHTSMNVTPSPLDREALKRLPRVSDYGYRIVSVILSCDLDRSCCVYRKSPWSLGKVSCSLIAHADTHCGC